ncbi:MAG: hypothetical protein HY900_04700 [Deltaproteobacteria bacterium]|nr:hypothetical protein [Deltaproteobacteria bacterium]
MDVTARTYEAQLGLRKIWRPLKRLRPYIGAGGSMLWVSYKIDGGIVGTGSDSQYGFGYWAGTGAFFRVGRSWQVGADARWSRVNLDVTNSSANAGGLQLGVTAGYHWSE